MAKAHKPVVNSPLQDLIALHARARQLKAEWEQAKMLVKERKATYDLACSELGQYFWELEQPSLFDESE